MGRSQVALLFGREKGNNIQYVMPIIYGNPKNETEKTKNGKTGEEK